MRQGARNRNTFEGVVVIYLSPLSDKDLLEACVVLAMALSFVMAFNLKK